MLAPNKPHSENEIQMYVVTQSHRAGLMFHADGNGNMVHMATAGRKKLMGSRAGWPDMVYIVGGRDGACPRINAIPPINACPRIIWFELKTARGVVSQPQREVHSKMRELGCEVHVIKAIDGPDAWSQMREIMNGIP